MNYDDWKTTEPAPFVDDEPDEDRCPSCKAWPDEPCTAECKCYVCLLLKETPGAA